jgi:hypothetical protein
MVYYTMGIVSSGAIGILLLTAMPIAGRDLGETGSRTVWALVFLGVSVLAAFLSGGLVLMLLSRRPPD